MTEILERQAKIIAELSQLLHEIINQISQYKEIEAEEQRLEEIERRRDGLETR